MGMIFASYVVMSPVGATPVVPAGDIQCVWESQLPQAVLPSRGLPALGDCFNILVTIESVGAPRLTQDQRDVLLGFLDASAADEPLLIKALQETRESWKWVSRETTAE